MEVSTGGESEGREDQGFAADSENQVTAPLPEEDLLRANVYALIARVLAKPMDDDTLAFARALENHDDDSEFGRALKTFGAVAARTSRSVAEEEFNALFYGDGTGGEVLPYASWHLTGLFYDKPLADLRGHMAELGIRTAEDNKEPEDHIASLCEMMHGLITGAFGSGVADLATQREFFNRHLAPWAERLFDDLEGASSAALYMPVGTLGRLFVAIEAEAFRMAA